MNRSRCGVNRFLLAISSACLFQTGAHANITVEGTGVSPSDLSDRAGFLSEFLQIGLRDVDSGGEYSPANGSVTVDAEGVVTELWSEGGMAVGWAPNSIGSFNAIGDGTPGSVKVNFNYGIGIGGDLPDLAWDEDDLPDVVYGGMGIVNVLNGAQMNANGVSVGTRQALLFFASSSFPKSVDNNPGFDGILTIDGEGSELNTDLLYVGDYWQAFSGQVNVLNGASLNVFDERTLYDGTPGFSGYIELENPNSELNVIGPGSRVVTQSMTASGNVLVDAGAEFNFLPSREGEHQLIIGGFQPTEFRVRGSGSRVSVHEQTYVGWTGLDADDSLVFEEGTLVVEELGLFESQGDIIVGGRGPYTEYPFPGSRGTLEVNDFGIVVADTVRIEELGVLTGNNGLIIADVSLEGGTIAPGASVGSTNILGDLVLDAGMIELEYFGQNWGEYDTINVLGDVLFGSDLQISLSLHDLDIPEISLEGFFNANSFTMMPGFDLASALDVDFGQNIGLRDGDIFTVSFQGYESEYVYRGSARAVPELNAAGLPMVLALLVSLMCMLRERRAV